jgi:hypothetical protein
MACSQYFHPIYHCIYPQYISPTLKVAVISVFGFRFSVSSVSDFSDLGSQGKAADQELRDPGILIHQTCIVEDRVSKIRC